MRDRSTFYGALLQSESEPLIKKLITDVNPLTVTVPLLRACVWACTLAGSRCRVWF